MGDRALKDCFPRLYRATRNQKERVMDVFQGNNSEALWFFDFRRELKEFEMGSLKDLKAMLKEFPMDLERDDELIWIENSFGIFSVKSLVEVASQNLVGS